ncbi:MAG: hypothetical protein U0401_19035 [Anaerolineae bacterium]
MADLLGPQAVVDEPPGMGAEDFAYMCQKAPGAMIMMGAALADGQVRHHHTNTFDIDEAALALERHLPETAWRFLTGEVSLKNKNLVSAWLDS